MTASDEAMPTTPTTLFVCTHSSARSQMAEGWLRHLAGGRYDVHSAGTEPRGVHPLAVRVMAEVGVDLSGHRSEHVAQYLDPPADIVVPVCDSAREACPYVPACAQRIHQSFAGPSVADGPGEQLVAFRRVRDEIEAWVRAMFVERALPTPTTP